MRRWRSSFVIYVGVTTMDEEEQAAYYDEQAELDEKYKEVHQDD